METELTYADLWNLVTEFIDNQECLDVFDVSTCDYLFNLTKSELLENVESSRIDILVSNYNKVKSVMNVLKSNDMFVHVNYGVNGVMTDIKVLSTDDMYNFARDITNNFTHFETPKRYYRIH